MKEFLRKSLHLKAFWPFLFVFLFVSGCCPGKFPPIKLGEAVKCPVAVAFIDANSFLNTQITKVNVTLIDPGGKVVTSNGIPFTTLQIFGGVMSLALKLSAELNAKSPYRFTLKAEADGYTTTYTNILIAADEGLYVPVFMAKMDDLPEGMASSTSFTPLTNGMIGNATFFNPTKSNGIPANKIRVDFAKGTQLIYCGQDEPNTPAPKNLNYRFSYASPKSVNASRTFPAGPLVTDALDLDGNVIARPGAPFYFATGGWVTMEMDADGKKVSGFNKPVTITMPIPDDLQNPQTGQAFKAGDKIDVWSLSDQGVWRMEGNAPVEGSPGNLFAKMAVTHLSVWNLDYKQDVCGGLGTPTSATITYTNAQSTDLYAYSEVRTTGGASLQGWSTNYMRYLAGGGSHSIINFPENLGALKVQVFQNGAGTPLVAESTPFSCTSPNANLSISTGGVENINVAFQVPSGGTDVALCNQVLWYNGCAGACPGGCGSIGTGYKFAGFLSGNPGTNSSELTFSKPAGGTPDNNCLRIWQAEVISGDTVQVAIDFYADLKYRSTVRKTIAGEKRANGTGAPTSVTIKHWYTAADSRHHFLIESGFTALPVCPN